MFFFYILLYLYDTTTKAENVTTITSRSQRYIKVRQHPSLALDSHSRREYSPTFPAYQAETCEDEYA